MRASGTSDRRRRLFVAEDEEAVDDVQAQEEDAEGPPRVVASDREERADRSEARAGDPDDPAERLACHQREARGELDHAEDDQDPTHGVEVGEDEPRVVDEDPGVIERSDAVDDVERAHDHQQRRRENCPAHTSHSALLCALFMVAPTFDRRGAAAHRPIGVIRLRYPAGRGVARPAGGAGDIGAFESPFTAAAPVSTPPVTPATAPADTTPAKLTVGGIGETVKRKALNKGLKVKIGANEPISAELTLLATPRKVTIAKLPSIALATKSLPRAGGTRTVTLKPLTKIKGKRSVKMRLTVVAFDAAGNRSSKTVAFTVK